MAKTPAKLQKRLHETSDRHIDRYFKHDAFVSGTPNWRTKQSGLIGRARIGRFTKDTGYEFKRRKVFFLITSGRAFRARGTFTIWRGVYTGDSYRDLQEFVYAGDNISSSSYKAAMAVARIWGTDDTDNWWTDEPFCYGDVCIIDRLAIATHSSAAEVEAICQIIEALIQRLQNGIAVIILKAFPLEYKSSVIDDNSMNFEKRQKALIRLYRRRLKLLPVPHAELAQEGWLMRLMKDGIGPNICG